MAGDAPMRSFSLGMVGLVITVILLSLTAAGASATSIRGAHACSSLQISTDRDFYAVGQPVNITVHFLHLLPGCFEFMIAHDYLIRTQILDPARNQVFSESNVTGSDIVVHYSWTASQPENYTIDSLVWLRLAGNETNSKLVEATKPLIVQGQTTLTVSEEISNAMGVGIGFLAVIVALAFARRRDSRRPSL